MGIIRLNGIYAPGSSGVSKPDHWHQICHHQRHVLPCVQACRMGSFNIELWESDWSAQLRGGYTPPDRNESNQGVSSHAIVVEINGVPVEAWIYFAGHGSATLELLASEELRSKLGVSHGDRLEVLILEDPVAPVFQCRSADRSLGSRCQGCIRDI